MRIPADDPDAEEEVAAGALPVAMASSSDAQQQQQQLIGTDVNICDLTLAPGIKPALERFCDATNSPAEKAKAMELLTALEMSSAIKAEAADGRPRRRALTPAASSIGGDCDVVGRSGGRPRTAAPKLQSPESRGGGGFSCVNSYETTHNYYYQPPVPSPSKAVRPASSQMQRPVPPPKELAPGNSFGDLFLTTTYGREFFAKNEEAPRPRPERAASARGVRNNNPHPNKEFMTWRYRRPMTATEKIESGATVAADSEAASYPLELEQQQQQQQQRGQLTNESFDRAVRGKCRTTYQHDYLGVPTDFDVNRREISLQTKPPPAYDRSSTARGAFARPAQLPQELSVTGARFGYHPTGGGASVGIIPAGGLGGQATLSGNTRTTYDAHINEPASRTMRVGDLRQLSNAQNAQAVARLVRGAKGEERAALAKLYREMQSRRLPVSIPMPVERRILKERVGGHMRVPTQPAWMSTWTGPA